MADLKVVRRTFEANKHPPGSEERARLNLDWLTSEYYPSKRYGLREADGGHTPYVYRTKAEAIDGAVAHVRMQQIRGAA